MISVACRARSKCNAFVQMKERFSAGVSKWFSPEHRCQRAGPRAVH